MALTDEEKEAIKNQLGRIPRGVLEITNYTKDGQPLVIKTNPIICEPCAPFPTLFYLTYPPTVEKVSRLEDKGLIKNFEKKIAMDKVLAKEFKKAQKSYMGERLELSKDKINNLNKGQKEVIKKTGVGGVEDLTKIKCLHAHYAHYLARSNNPVGKLVDKLMRSEMRDTGNEN